MRRTSFVLAGAATSLALAACGGSGGPSKADYIKKADAICAKGSKEAEQVAASAFKNPATPTGEEAQAALQKVIPIQKQRVDELKALKRPDADKAKLETLYAAVDKINAAYEQAAQSPEASLALIRASGSPQDPAAVADKLAADYGMKDCAK
jgi:hypothetical protein